ncbi:MAG: carboxypeptidase-like regulatory domain-containing protein [Marinilabiliaceae bacterium]|jgi:hypothetical protein|nr:carboxypeptidase-like regulatory domain-containing protein [Marinilabiliaceae bacterium]
MSKAENNKDIRSEINKYLSGEMSPEERNSFEREMQKDPFLADAVEGLSAITPAEAESDLAALKGRIYSKDRRNRFLFYRVAAVALLLIGVSSIILLRQLSQPDLLSESLIIPGPEAGYQIESIAPVEDVTEEESINQTGGLKQEEKIILPAEQERSVAAPEKKAESEERNVFIVDEAEVFEDISIDSMVAGKLKVAVLDTKANVDVKTEAIVSETLEDRVAGVQAERKIMLRETARPEAGDTSRKPLQKSGIIKGRTIAYDDSMPLPGVAISIKGTEKGVTSDIDGNFVLEADSGDVLVANFIGMKSKEVVVERNKLNDIILEPDMMALEEVVVVAYSEAKKRTVSETGAVSEISLDEQGISSVHPGPVGGMPKYRAYINDNISFPEDWKESGREVVRIRFTVQLNGELTDFEIVRSPDSLFSREAIRLIKEGPGWTPAMNNNAPVIEKTGLRIVFRR